ncbi:glycosyltransferase [Ectobacillus sp. JY-23]|uniref:glycosyltransferase family 2 protein n=1 Tax=Ectobacillus sp. JY-23 TaxID=2933872 RepID=UPI001FF3AB9E|nr:glycosyltransferase [Ectobacillus sp. JY-23]UOY91799.1 glycosyltransferase [Ectobacillus sp. JY-23]
MKISVIIPAQNEGKTIGAVIEQAKQLLPHEIIVVVNGSTDRTAEVASSLGCKVTSFAQALGNDVGRAIGAREATGDILLFLDGDIVIAADQLRLFTKAIRNGHDIALNNLTWSVLLKIRPHYTTVGKLILNRYLNKKELVVGSLIAIPHAMSKKAVERIGWRTLADPALVQAMAVHLGMSIVSPASVDVIHTNKIRPVHLGSSPGSPYPKATSRIMGDHLRAIQYIIDTYGRRGGFTTGKTDRKLSYRYTCMPKKRAKYSAIIPTASEPDTISAVIEQVKKAGVDEIIVVANGADEITLQKAKKANVIVLEFAEELGHNVARAIGAMHATADICLFIDSDFPVSSEDLLPFLCAVENGVDVALNDLQHLLDVFHPIDPVSAGKYFVNMAAKRPDLWNNSLTAVPHAMHRRVIEAIGYDALTIPPLAQVKAMLKGYKVEAVHYVDVLKPNRIRPEHGISNGRIPAFERIFGDQMEALAYLLEQTNERGGFTDGERARDLL